MEAIDFIKKIIENLNGIGFPFLVFVIGVLEFSFGLYKGKWPKGERYTDIACFILPKLVIRPVVAYYGLKFLPAVLPNLKNEFEWVPFWWGCGIIAVADDLTQYWYHRLHHEIPWLWRFHRTHHSTPYMGMAMASRQNVIYSLFFSQTYLTTALVYLGLGIPAVVVKGIKGAIVTFAHSSIPWDKPFYKYKVLHPIAWVFERVISTPATHHAHHAASTDDGIGYYKGNFGNMFFLWDIIFDTAFISRKYPKAYGISHYEGDEWYAQLAWPFFKSKVVGSELAKNGPIIRQDEHVAESSTPLAAGINEEYNLSNTHINAKIESAF
ncbi:sterol desaturase [Sphingobacteriaceae bacterium GW460-11-11-14-LB5]|nr:sterol desaturase [Sphingobacteriaceae bacterium GW460-11-11-14-LB5]